MAAVMMGFSISLDGFIASAEREDAGLHDWLFAGNLPIEVAGTEFRTDSEQSAAMFRETVDSIGSVIVGRTAYGDDGDEAFFDLPTFVLTHRQPPAEHNPKVTYVLEGIVPALELAKAAAGDKQVNVFGGASTAQQYLAAGLIDELHLTVVPILFGDGLRLFGPDTPRRAAEIISSIATPTVTHLHLRFTKRS